MTKNLNNSICNKSETVNKTEQPVLKERTSYRGFTSIDQEMERAIAMQWFAPSEKIFHHGIVVKRS